MPTNWTWCREKTAGVPIFMQQSLRDLLDQNVSLYLIICLTTPCFCWLLLGSYWDLSVISACYIHAVRCGNSQAGQKDCKCSVTCRDDFASDAQRTTRTSQDFTTRSSYKVILLISKHLSTETSKDYSICKQFFCDRAIVETPKVRYGCFAFTSSQQKYVEWQSSGLWPSASAVLPVELWIYRPWSWCWLLWQHAWCEAKSAQLKPQITRFHKMQLSSQPTWIIGKIKTPGMTSKIQTHHFSNQKKAQAVMHCPSWSP